MPNGCKAAEINSTKLQQLLYNLMRNTIFAVQN